MRIILSAEEVRLACQMVIWERVKRLGGNPGEVAVHLEYLNIMPDGTPVPICAVWEGEI